MRRSSAGGLAVMGLLAGGCGGASEDGTGPGGDDRGAPVRPPDEPV